MNDFLPRYAPEVELPPYTYVPGLAPHPQSDPAGHAFGKQREAVSAIDDSNWRRSTTYLHAIDLFNRGYYWEAHEAWESLWHACGRRGPIADFLKGLIKLAAAGVKVRERRAAGVASHARRAAELFRAASPDGGEMLGQYPDRLASEAEAAAAARLPAIPAASDDGPSLCRPVPVFSFQMVLRAVAD